MNTFLSSLMRTSSLAVSTALLLAGPLIASANTQTSPPGSQTYATPGMYTFTVPAGVTSVNVALNGAGGGTGCHYYGSSPSSPGSPGGSGGRTQGTLTVTPGQTLTVMVGGAGSAIACSDAGSSNRVNGGFGGGGKAQNGGSGGGRSAILVNSAELMTAGGGGGGGATGLVGFVWWCTTGGGPGNCPGGSGGGINGGNGTVAGTSYPTTGNGGTQTGPGTNPANPSVNGSGHQGGDTYLSNGGGGGGWYGGSGSSHYGVGGGGGGSGHCDPSLASCTTTQGTGSLSDTDGRVVISWAGQSGPAFTQSTTATQNPSVGGIDTITTTIQNTGGATNALIDMEVYQNGTRVGQKFFDNQSFSTNQSRAYTYPFTVPSAGTYTVSIGVFHAGWAGVQAWFDQVASFTAASGGGGGGGGQALSIYQDALAQGWENWSWNITKNYSDTSLVFSGTHALKVTYNAPWGGLFLHHAGVNTTGKSTLNFAIAGGGAGGQNLQIYTSDSNGVQSLAKNLSQYVAGGIVANTWKQVSIPLADIGAANKMLTGIVIQDVSGMSGASIHIDAMQIQ